MKNIEFARLFDSIEPLYEEYMDKIGKLIRETEFIGGPEVECFETEFAKWTESGYAIGTANGTDSLIIALKALNIGPGDKVLVPVNTFIATSETVTMVGADVDFIDVEDEFYTMDPVALEAYLSSPKGSKVKAVIPVHLYGQMADMPAIMAIAGKFGLKVIEDSAQAHGSRLNGKQPGSFGDLATYSFYPGKNLGAFGDAGAITTNDPGLHRTCKMLVNHGRWQAKYEHEIEGFNMRLDTLQAAVLRIKLRHLSDWTIKRKAKAAEYLRLLSGKTGIIPPSIRTGADPVWHIFAVRMKERDAIQKKLKENGISAGIHYPIPLHLQPAYSHKGYSRGAFPVAERHATEELSLPIWPEISMEDIATVVSELMSR